MDKVLGKIKKNKTLLDVVEKNKGIMIGDRVVPPIVFEYLKAHPNERMYISKNYNTVQTILVRAMKWKKEQETKGKNGNRDS